MYGSDTFKWVYGKWDHYGTLKTDNVPLGPAAPDEGTLPRGTMLDISASDEEQAALGSGSAIGVMVQDIDNEGLTGLQGFQDFSIGKLDRNVKKGRPVSLRVPVPGAFLEFEGDGAANPGNLVATSGTGSISSGTAKGVELSCLNGCLYVAQSGDTVFFHMEKADVTPENAGNTRVRVKAVGPYTKA